MENFEEKIESLKSRAEEIRSLNGERLNFHWPKEFRAEVINLVSCGISRRLLAERLMIKHGSLDCWVSKHRRKQKKLAQEFREVKIVEPKEKIKHLHLVSRQGVEIHGLELSDVLKIIREGLI